MTPKSAWHPDEDALQSYVDGRAGRVLTASLESHVLACATCRDALAPAVSPLRLATVLDGIDGRLDALARPRLERLACRLGMGEADARVLLAAPSMRRAWWFAVVLALGLAVLAALQEPGRGDALLVLAPLLPVVATAASYAPRLDPALSLTAATPYPAMRLLLLRSGAVSVAASLLGVAATAALPVGPGEALVWLLPAAALTAAALALSGWVDAEVAAGACCVAWLTTVWTVGRSRSDALAIYDAHGQLAALAVLAAAAVVLVRQRHRLDPGSPA